MPFRLDLFRHGEAAPAGQDGDPARPLSPTGRRDVARVAEEYARQGWRPDRVYASPLLRAQETAVILLSRLGTVAQAETLRELVPDHGPLDVLSALTLRGASGHLVLVGHQPLLGQLATLLIGGKESRLPPGGMIRIELDRDLVPGTGREALRVLPEDLA